MEEPTEKPHAVTTPSMTIAECVVAHLEKYFQDLEDSEPQGVYSMVIEAVERPLLQHMLERAEFNQTRASAMLGLSRNTLYKKLRHHQLITD